MAKLLKLRRGTTTQHNSFTGAEGEVTVDTTKDSLVVHDGSTQGGHPIAKSSDIAGYAALTGATFTGDILVDNQQEVRYGEADSNGSNYVSFKGPSTISSNVSWTLPSADGNNNDALTTDGSGTLSWVPSGANKLDLTGGTLTGHVIIDNQKQVRFSEADSNGGEYLSFKSPAALSATVNYILPGTDGSAGHILTTDGSGNLSFAAAAAAGATGGGNDEIFVENERTVTTSYSITATKNAHSVGPISINNNIVVTIPANSTWLVH